MLVIVYMQTEHEAPEEKKHQVHVRAEVHFSGVPSFPPFFLKRMRIYITINICITAHHNTTH